MLLWLFVICDVSDVRNACFMAGDTKGDKLTDFPNYYAAEVPPLSISRYHHFFAACNEAMVAASTAINLLQFAHAAFGKEAYNMQGKAKI